MSNNSSVFGGELVQRNKQNFLLTHCSNGTFPEGPYLIKEITSSIQQSNLAASSTEDLERLRSPFAHSIYQPGIHISKKKNNSSYLIKEIWHTSRTVF
jgi:hypothetical protein